MLKKKVIFLADVNFFLFSRKVFRTSGIIEICPSTTSLRKNSKNCSKKKKKKKRQKTVKIMKEPPTSAAI